jgi:hypothetical protein
MTGCHLQQIGRRKQGRALARIMAVMIEVTNRWRGDRKRLTRMLADPLTASKYSASLYLTPESCEAVLTDRREGLLTGGVRADMAEIVEATKPGETGLCLFEGPPDLGEQGYLAIVPPFPITRDHEARGFDPEPMIELLQRDRTVLVVLVRLGHYSVGLLDGDTVVASKSGTRHVKNRHRKGGSSQRRFERSRERLMREFFDRVCVEARRLLEGEPQKQKAPRTQGRMPQYVIYGGEAQTVRGFKERCEYLERLKAPALARLLPVDRPGHKVMQAMGKEIYSSATLELKQVDGAAASGPMRPA